MHLKAGNLQVPFLAGRKSSFERIRYCQAISKNLNELTCKPKVMFILKMTAMWSYSNNDDIHVINRQLRLCRNRIIHSFNEYCYIVII